MEEKKPNVFRKKTLERISSPEQLKDYLRVTNPGIWIVLAVVILLLGGLFAWSMIGTLETTAQAKVIVKDKQAQVIPVGSEKLEEGMSLRVGSEEYEIAATETDKYGRVTGKAGVTLPDGSYDGTVVVDQVHPFDFLLKGR